MNAIKNIDRLCPLSKIHCPRGAIRAGLIFFTQRIYYTPFRKSCQPLWTVFPPGGERPMLQNIRAWALRQATCPHTGGGAGALTTKRGGLGGRRALAALGTRFSVCADY